MLFAAESPFTWAAEAKFKILIAEHPDIGRAHQRHSVFEIEKGLHDIDTEHKETVAHD